LILTNSDGNIRVVTHSVSPFEKMGIGKWIQDIAYKSLRTKPIDDEDDTKLIGGYVS